MNTYETIFSYALFAIFINIIFISFIDFYRNKKEINQKKDNYKTDEVDKVDNKTNKTNKVDKTFLEMLDYIKKLEYENLQFDSKLNINRKLVRELKEKKFWHNENGDEYWIYQGDEFDNIETLTCPIIISKEDLLDLIGKKIGKNNDD